jgi:hypothetical protein
MDAAPPEPGTPPSGGAPPGARRLADVAAWAAVFAPSIALLAGTGVAWTLGTGTSTGGEWSGLGTVLLLGVAALYGGLVFCVGSWVGVLLWGFAMYQGGASPRVRTFGLIVNLPGCIASLWFLPLLPTLLGNASVAS